MGLFTENYQLLLELLRKPWTCLLEKAKPWSEKRLAAAGGLREQAFSSQTGGFFVPWLCLTKVIAWDQPGEASRIVEPLEGTLLRRWGEINLVRPGQNVCNLELKVGGTEDHGRPGTQRA